MAYIKTEWENEPSENTPLNAGNLNKIENGIYNNSINIGELEDLDTTDKSSIVAAINEVNQKDTVVDSLDGSSTTEAPSVRAVNEGLGLRQYEPVSLYTNTSGESGTVNLSDSTANYNYLEIFCKDSNGVSSSTKVEAPNGKKVNLMTTKIETGSIQFFTKNVSISTTTITNIEGYTIKMQSSSITAFNNSNTYILITKVIGYK